MARVYATATDAWPDGAPATADRLLRTASRVVDVILRGVVYDTDTAGLPTDTDVAETLRDATVSIALAAEAAGSLDAVAGQEWGSVSIGNVSLSNPLGGADAEVLGIPVPNEARLALLDLGPAQVTVR